MPGLFGTEGPAERDAADRLRWPADLSPQFSDVWACNEKFINAAPSTVFSCLIAASRWEQDFAGIRDVRLNEPSQGCLAPGGEFTFEIEGLHLFALVTEFVPVSRLAWCGQGIDITTYQAWDISDADAGSRALAGLAARGAAAIAIRETALGAAQMLLDRWLGDLKAVAERNER